MYMYLVNKLSLSHCKSNSENILRSTYFAEIARFFGPLCLIIQVQYTMGVGGPWRVSMDELMDKNLPYFVGGNLATL